MCGIEKLRVNCDLQYCEGSLNRAKVLKVGDPHFITIVRLTGSRVKLDMLHS